MKLGKSVLVAIMASLQKGLTEGVDISNELRNIDVEVKDGKVEVEEKKD